MLRITASVWLACLLATGRALAIAPEHMTDSQLAQSPVIVVAQWNKAEMRPHKLVEGNALKKYEVFTELQVIRAVKGNVKPGKQTLLLGWGVAWRQDGTDLRTGTSTDLPGDVDDVTKPNLWFLTKSRSWDKSDQNTYYCVPHYRAIQPLSLESYFVALASPEPEEEVPKLLSCKEPEAIRRILRYICGGILPWPYEPQEWEKSQYHEKRERLLKEQTPAVRQVIDRDVAEVRGLAASVYAELAGKSCVPDMRSLLNDRDPEVRAVAVGVLARHLDAASIDAMKDAVKGLNEPHLACQVVKELSSWSHPRLPPVLISFLENDSSCGRCGKDVSIPALKAREGLHILTHCWFPFDVEACLQTWDQVAGITDAEQRWQKLRRILPVDGNPLQAELLGPLDNASIKVTNASVREVTLAAYPTWVDANTARLWSFAQTGYKKPTGKADFILLRPGDSTQFPTRFGDEFDGVRPEELVLSLFYGDIGSKFGLHGWIGWVDVRRIRAPKPETRPSPRS